MKKLLILHFSFFIFHSAFASAFAACGCGVAPERENDFWWENDKFMNWQKKIKGAMEPMLERRQGLIDRSKTPFWLVNHADYELVQ